MQYPLFYPINNDLGAIVTLSAAAVGVNSTQLTSPGTRGVKVVVNITAITGTSPTLTVTIQGYDTASGNYYTLLASTALSSTGMTELTVYPGVTTSSNVAASDDLPLYWRVSTVIGGATPAVTATIGACLLV